MGYLVVVGRRRRERLALVRGRLSIERRSCPDSFLPREIETDGMKLLLVEGVCISRGGGGRFFLFLSLSLGTTYQGVCVDREEERGVGREATLQPARQRGREVDRLRAMHTPFTQSRCQEVQSDPESEGLGFLRAEDRWMLVGTGGVGGRCGGRM